MENILQQFKDWVSGFLSQPQPFLKDIPACPFAKEGLEQNKFHFVMFPENLEGTLEAEVQRFISCRKEAVIFLKNGKYPLEHLLQVVHDLRERYFREDVWVLFDDPRFPEVQGHLPFNFQHGTLIIIQRLTQLTEASRLLKNRGYYDNWSEDYYNLVVQKREHYYQQFIESHTNAASSLSIPLS